MFYQFPFRRRSIPARMCVLFRLALFCLVVGCTWDGHAAPVPMRLNISGSVYVLDEITEENGVYESKVSRLRLTNRDLLLFLQDWTSETFPVGAYLEAQPDGRVLVRTRTGYSRDVSMFISVGFNLDRTELVHGKFNMVTGQLQAQSIYTLDLFITAPTDFLNLHCYGVAFDRLTGPPLRNGSQRVNQNLRSTMSGKGTVFGVPIFFEGRATMYGSEVQTPEL